MTLLDNTLSLAGLESGDILVACQLMPGLCDEQVEWLVLERTKSSLGWPRIEFVCTFYGVEIFRPTATEYSDGWEIVL